MSDTERKRQIETDKETERNRKIDKETKEVTVRCTERGRDKEKETESNQKGEIKRLREAKKGGRIQRASHSEKHTEGQLSE